MRTSLRCRLHEQAHSMISTWNKTSPLDLLQNRSPSALNIGGRQRDNVNGAHEPAAAAKLKRKQVPRSRASEGPGVGMGRTGHIEKKSRGCSLWNTRYPPNFLLVPWRHLHAQLGYSNLDTEDQKSLVAGGVDNLPALHVAFGVADT